jgi:hypothetical protein
MDLISFYEILKKHLLNKWFILKGIRKMNCYFYVNKITSWYLIGLMYYPKTNKFSKKEFATRDLKKFYSNTDGSIPITENELKRLKKEYVKYLLHKPEIKISNWPEVSKEY